MGLTPSRWRWWTRSTSSGGTSAVPKGKEGRTVDKQPAARLPMIQDIAPHRYRVAYAPCPPQESDRCFLFRGREILERRWMASLPFPLGGAGCGPGGEPLALPDRRDGLLSVHGRGERSPCPWGMPGTTLSGSTGPRSPASSALPSPRPTTCPFGIGTTSSAAAAAGRPSPTIGSGCSASRRGNLIYPKIAPAVIVAVTDGDRILMTRYQGRAYKRLCP